MENTEEKKNSMKIEMAMEITWAWSCDGGQEGGGQFIVDAWTVE
jgi:hypothetical protein